MPLQMCENESYVIMKCGRQGNRAYTHVKSVTSQFSDLYFERLAVSLPAVKHCLILHAALMQRHMHCLASHNIQAPITCAQHLA